MKAQKAQRTQKMTEGKEETKRIGASRSDWQGPKGIAKHLKCTNGKLAPICFTFLLSGCSPTPPQIYEAPPKVPNNQRSFFFALSSLIE